jgi:hypothetical protein
MHPAKIENIKAKNLSFLGASETVSMGRRNRYLYLSAEVSKEP